MPTLERPPTMRELASASYLRWRGALESWLNRDHGLRSTQLDHTTDFYIALYQQDLTPRQAAFIAAGYSAHRRYR